MIETCFIDDCLYARIHTRAYQEKQVVVIVQAFAEEMNKSRRQMTMLAGRLAQDGIATVIFDLSGTGDSQGDFSQATWTQWQKDVAQVHKWCLSQWPTATLSALGHRLGALLLASCQLHWQQLVFWQPVFKGEQQITQFLRLQLAAATNNNAITTQSLRTTAQEQGQIEVAGYCLGADLIKAIDAELLKNYVLAKTHVFELSSAADEAAPTASPGLERYLASQTGVTSTVLTDTQFWTTQEISTAPLLLSETVRYFSGLGPHE